MAPGQDVHVQMLDGLPAIGPRIYHRAETTGASLGTESSRNAKEVRQQSRVARFDQLGIILHVLDRHNQQVRRRLGVDIANRYNVGIPMRQRRRNFSGSDFAKDAVGFHASALAVNTRTQCACRGSERIRQSTISPRRAPSCERSESPVLDR